jgi:DNA mismatch repair ATPase MutL
MLFSTVHIAVKNALLNAQTLSDKCSDTAVIPTAIPPREALAAVPSEMITLASAKTEYAVVKPPPSAFTQEPVQAQYKYINPESLVKNVKNTASNQTLLQNEHNERERERFAFVGELFTTYIMCEQGGDVVLIDKHAADERLRFERIKAELKTYSQLLVEPLEVRLDNEACGVLVAEKEELERVGVEIEFCEPGVLRVTAVPTLLKCSQIESILNDVAKMLKFGGDSVSACINDEIVHRLACRAAIKAGDKSDTDDLRLLAERVLTDDTGVLQYCPHGRPIVVRISRRELEKKFKRVL